VAVQNCAQTPPLDFLKSHGRKYVEPHADLDELAGFEDKPDPAVVRAALARFLTLPVTQRQRRHLEGRARALFGRGRQKTMGTTLMAVKSSARARTRGKLLQQGSEEAAGAAPGRAELDRYASLFNATPIGTASGRWSAMTAGSISSPNLSATGKQVGMYFARYEQENLSAARGAGRRSAGARGCIRRRPKKPAYFILLEFEAGKVKAIRDFRYVPYIARGGRATAALSRPRCGVARACAQTGEPDQQQRAEATRRAARHRAVAGLLIRGDRAADGAIGASAVGAGAVAGGRQRRSRRANAPQAAAAEALVAGAAH